MMACIMISYTRARAENFLPQCKVGFMERPERVVLFIIGALFNKMAPVLWIIAVLGTVTVIGRMMYTWRELKPIDDQSMAEQREASNKAQAKLSGAVAHSEP
jgi:CDP-diacylglycerol--glycerol-3-phosphate 3-phosphatidyltransferase